MLIGPGMHKLTPRSRVCTALAPLRLKLSGGLEGVEGMDPCIYLIVHCGFRSGPAFHSIFPRFPWDHCLPTAASPVGSIHLTSPPTQHSKSQPTQTVTANERPSICIDPGTPCPVKRSEPYPSTTHPYLFYPVSTPPPLELASKPLTLLPW